MPTLKINLTPESLARIDELAKSPDRVRQLLSRGLVQGGQEIAAHLKASYFAGYNNEIKPPRGMIGVRSGALRRDIDSGRVDDTTVWIGMIAGETDPYAHVILGDGSWDITPKNAQHLWVPIADNLTPSGVGKMTPAAAMAFRTMRGKRALRIFKSKAGNLVAFLPGEEERTGRAVVRGTGRFKRGKNKGRLRGRLLFVLVKSVHVEGTGALNKAIEAKRPRVLDLLHQGLLQGMGRAA